ncbi:hypothetical protein ACS0TY_036262 [Phlomoides rotata]
MASDILSISVFTVASESTFSAGGRVIDDLRASMTVETVQMLLCGNDWIHNVYGIKTRPRVSEIFIFNLQISYCLIMYFIYSDSRFYFVGFIGW